MRRIDGAHGVDGDWKRVSAVTPCPICGGGGDCRTHADEAFACCVQQPSDWRLTNGGWLHRITARGVKVVASSVTRRTGERLLADAALTGVIP
jgi:hypothetical protein